MAAATAVQCRGGEGGGGSGMKTVECLRGRLLAERVASKAAKEEADSLAKRLGELEKKLSDEVKIRNKAERRLRRAIKKLESLKILDVELSDCSIGSLSSSNGCSGHRAPETEADMNNPGSSAGSCTQVNSSQEGSWCSVLSEQSPSVRCKEEENGLESEDAKNYGSGEDAGDHDSESRDDQQPVHVLPSDDGSSKSEDNQRDEDDDRLALVLVDPQPRTSEEAGEPRTGDDDDTAQVAASKLQAESDERDDGMEERNELAIVLVDPQPQPKAEEQRPRPSNDVQSVLLALRQVKEQLRYTIERRSELVAHQELCGH
uniref:Uncharacterized protein n=1 Tax=Leersia perrieri TaxID=77586 RepID=A0A0D9VSP2_9ORYZ